MVAWLTRNATPVLSAPWWRIFTIGDTVGGLMAQAAAVCECTV